MIYYARFPLSSWILCTCSNRFHFTLWQEFWFLWKQLLKRVFKSCPLIYNFLLRKVIYRSRQVSLTFLSDVYKREVYLTFSLNLNSAFYTLCCTVFLNMRRKPQPIFRLFIPPPEKYVFGQRTPTAKTSVWEGYSTKTCLSFEHYFELLVWLSVGPPLRKTVKF